MYRRRLRQSMIRLYYIFKLIVRGLSLRPWGSFLTLIACWFALFQLSLVFYAVDLADRASSLPSTSGSMIAYVGDGISNARIADIEKAIRSRQEVAKVEFIPRQVGLERMRQWLGPNSSLVEGVDSDILPDAFEITLKRGHADKVAAIAAVVGKIPFVDNVRYRKGLMGYIAGAFMTIVIFASALGTIVVICLALVIFLSIRVGIVSRRQEIEVMGMLGASYVFIYSPYLIEACAYGIGGSGIALLTTSVTQGYLHVHFPVIQAFVRPLGAYQAAGVLFFGCCCGILGALLAIKRSIDA